MSRSKLNRMHGENDTNHLFLFTPNPYSDRNHTKPIHFFDTPVKLKTWPLGTSSWPSGKTKATVNRSWHHHVARWHCNLRGWKPYYPTGSTIFYDSFTGMNGWFGWHQIHQSHSNLCRKSIYLARVIQIYLDRFQSFYPHFVWNTILIFERWNQNPLSHLVQNLWNLILVVFTALFVYVIIDLVQYPCIETTLLTLDHFKFQPPLTMNASFRCHTETNNNLNIKIYCSQYTLPNISILKPKILLVDKTNSSSKPSFL